MFDLKALGQKLRNIFGEDTKGLEAFEFDTTGEVPQRVDTRVTPDHGPLFKDGWWLHADRFDINKGRAGGAIVPWCTVVHTTDMAPGTMSALLKRWRELPGEGAGAHFLIGRAPNSTGNMTAIPTGGIVQMIPITRNGNHAGGPGGKHGWFKLPTGRLIHPNSVSVGIELDNAGRLMKKDGLWVHKDSGRVIPDVFVDAHGRGYERITAYQMSALELLLDDLNAVLTTVPAGVTIAPNGTYKANGCPEAELPTCREVGHWTLDPYRKTDPGSQVTEFLRARALR